MPNSTYKEPLRRVQTRTTNLLAYKTCGKKLKQFKCYNVACNTVTDRKCFSLVFSVNLLCTTV